MSIGRISPSWLHVFFKFLGICSSLAASLIWLATIATLFGLWAKDGFVRYEHDDGEVVFISNVGARHKAVFIVGTALTGILFVATLILNKICFDMENRKRFKRGMSIISIIFGIIAGISLLLLAVFDSMNYNTVHYVFTGLFMVFTLLSAISSTLYRFSHYEINLAVSLRVLFISLVIPLVITFVVMTLIKLPDNQIHVKSVAASIEWSVAILFVVYLALFALDLVLNNNHTSDVWELVY